MLQAMLEGHSSGKGDGVEAPLSPGAVLLQAFQQSLNTTLASIQQLAHATSMQVGPEVDLPYAQAAAAAAAGALTLPVGMFQIQAGGGSTWIGSTLGSTSGGVESSSSGKTGQQLQDLMQQLHVALQVRRGEGILPLHARLSY
jgi:hypothetical protein